MRLSSSRPNATVNRNSDTSSSSSYMSSRDRDKYVEEYNFPFCDDASKYEKVAKIGQGTFG